MNSIWNKNISLFTKHFPQLAQLLLPAISSFSEASVVFSDIAPAKNGSVTASENSLRLHSAYNPEREAQSAVSSAVAGNENCRAVVFAGFGLGYAVKEACSFSDKKLVVIEPDATHFLSALFLVDWSDVFSFPNIVLAVGCTPEQAISLINANGVLESAFVSVKAQTAHAQPYFDALFALIERNRHKEKINNATTKKFARRWNLNCLKNAGTVALLDGVSVYKGRAENLPFTVIAAGPSLSQIIPYAAEIQRRTVTVCVDTSLRAMLSAGVQPDFIIITDPQYWAYRHIAGLEAPSSVLITSCDVYPAAFRFKGRKTVCCSSQLPVGKYFERHCGEKGDLGAGGSVASCAWNFAHFCGAQTVFTAGLDLSFPKKQTHIRGSSFEQNVHSCSARLFPAETLSMPLLFSGNAEPALDYAGNKVQTDQRMKMFAWWFESRLAECPETKTYALSPSGLRIPGIALSSVSELLRLPVIEREKSRFFAESEKNTLSQAALQKAELSFQSADRLLKKRLSGIPLSDFETVRRIADSL